MLECYHPTVKFRDPIFGSLNANEVSKMWEMLIIRSSGNLKIKLSDVKPMSIMERLFDSFL
jgi:hypothetical protein